MDTLSAPAILGSAGILGGVGLVFAALIAVTHRKFKVWEDPRIDMVAALLPGNNCGACGLPGCRAFAEKAVAGAIAPGPGPGSRPGAPAAVAGGGKGCVWGCLGLADCAVACTFDAIRMNAVGLPIVAPGRCTACGDSVEACPQDPFVLIPIEHKLLVQ